MEYVAKHSADQNDAKAREAFYADPDIWDHEFDDPYETQTDDADEAN